MLCEVDQLVILITYVEKTYSVFFTYRPFYSSGFNKILRYASIYDVKWMDRFDYFSNESLLLKCTLYYHLLVLRTSVVHFYNIK